MPELLGMRDRPAFLILSWIASRPDDEHERVLGRLGELLPEGTYSIPNLANVLWAVRA